MAWTWTEVISRALVRSGLLGRGQTASASLKNEGVSALRLILDRLDGEGLALPAFKSDIAFNTISGQAKYLLGLDVFGDPGDTIVRPETIIAATCIVTPNPATRNELVPMNFADYVLIPVPLGTAGQPWNYAINPTFPQMEFYLYPTPSQVYPITITAKVRWVDTVVAPDLNPFAVLEADSGYPAGMVDILALELAEEYRLETPTLQNKARNAKFMIAQHVYTQQRKAGPAVPIGLFPWQIGMVGRNP